MSRPMIAGRKVAWFLGIVALGAIVYFGFIGGPKTAKKVEFDQSLLKVQAPALLPMDTGKVTQMTLTLSGQRTVAEKTNGKWYMREPYKDQASDADVERVIGLFSALASDEKVSDPGSTAKYGLNKPWGHATFVEGGQRREFSIGKPGKEELYYVKTSASSDVFIVRGIAEELAVLRPIDLVNRQLLNFNPADIVSIDAVSKDGNIQRKVQKRDGKWTSDSGVVFEVEEFLRDLQYVNVNNVVGASSSQGLSPSGSTMHIVLTRKDGKKHTLDIGNKSDNDRLYYVKSSDRPHVYQVVQFIAENLRDKLRRVGTDMMGLNPDRVRELKLIRVDDKSQTTEKLLTKSDGDWSSDGQVAFSVSGVIDSIIGVNAQKPAPEADDATYGFNPAPGSVQINATLDNKAVITLDLGAKTPDGASRYVRSSARKGVYLSPAKNVDIILAALAKVRSQLMVFEPTAVNRITVSQSDWSGKTHSVTGTKNGSAWTIAGKARKIDQVNTFLNTLKGLGADKIPPKEEEAAYGFYPAADSYRIELGFTNGTKLTLDIGATRSEGTGWFAITNYFVRISDLSDVVFVSEFDVDELKEAWDAISR